MHEPAGWKRLKAAAENAPDAHSLALIIEEMNRILYQHEKIAEDEGQCTLDSGVSRRNPGLEVQVWQYD
jgi:hypothetical protein